MSLKYEIVVRNFTCPECAGFSDEYSEISTDFEKTYIHCPDCEEELWLYDLQMDGQDVREVYHTAQAVCRVENVRPL